MLQEGYYGQTLNGFAYGNGINIFPSGNRYEGGFINDEPHGKGVFLYLNEMNGQI